MHSLLFRSDSPVQLEDSCDKRTEIIKRYIKNGSIYTTVLRDKITIEDPYLVLVKSSIYAIANDEPYGGKVPRRDYRDYLIKNSVFI
jgi:hypothetical protein